ncbi:MAG: RDD family protein [Oscillospiraceae bacterium]|nr:RDD family protein [Oscillospiraceae bacterium]
MNFIYKTGDGGESAPIELDDMIKLIEQRKIAPTTQVRNVIIANFSPAASHEALKAALKRMYGDAAERPASSGNAGRTSDAPYIPSGAKKIQKIVGGGSGAWRSGDPVKRILAGLFDMVWLVLILFIMLLGMLQLNWNEGRVFKWDGFQFVELPPSTPHGNAFAFFYEKQEFSVFDEYLEIRNEKNQTALCFVNAKMKQMTKDVVFWWTLLSIGYYLATLGGSGKTFGMTLFHLDLTDDQGVKAGFPQACRYTGFLLLLGWAYILTALFTRGVGLHSLLSRTRVI